MNAEKTVGEQSQTVNVIKDAFRQIYNATEEVIADVAEVENKVKGMDREKEGTLEAISSISEVSQQTTISSGKLFSIAQGQKEVVGSLTQESEELKMNTEELKKAISVFKTTEER